MANMKKFQLFVALKRITTHSQEINKSALPVYKPFLLSLSAGHKKVIALHFQCEQFPLRESDGGICVGRNGWKNSRRMLAILQGLPTIIVHHQIKIFVSLVEVLLHFRILSGQFNMIFRRNEVCHAFWLPFRKDANNKNDNELSISNWIKNQPPLM